MIRRADRIAAARRAHEDEQAKTRAAHAAQADAHRASEAVVGAREALLGCSDHKQVIALWKAYRQAQEDLRAKADTFANARRIAAEATARTDSIPTGPQYGYLGPVV